ncbi:MAG: SxtJ family membrane protein [Lentisphaeria bacterium]
MSLIKLKLKPSDDELRDFGAVSLCMLVILGLLCSWVLGWQEAWLRYAASLGLALYVLSRISAKLILPFYQLLMLLGFPIGWLISHLVVACFYYLILTPLGLLFRLMKRDPLKRSYEPEAQSYWRNTAGADKKPGRYLQQF